MNSLARLAVLCSGYDATFYPSCLLTIAMNLARTFNLPGYGLNTRIRSGSNSRMVHRSDETR